MGLYLYTAVLLEHLEEGCHEAVQQDDHEKKKKKKDHLKITLDRRQIADKGDKGI